MNGYKIIYRRPNGDLDSTLMRRPIASEKIHPDDEPDVVCVLFEITHPSCKVISICPGDYAAFRGLYAE